MKAVALILLSALLAVFARGQSLEINPVEGLNFKQNLGVQVPLNLPFKDETGKDVILGDYFKERPVILVLVFYQCQSSCLLIRDGLLKTLNAQRALRVGRDFDIVVVSINHKETPELAALKKDAYLADYRYPESGDGWHLLTGTKDNIRTLADTVGFEFKFDEVVNPETKEVTDQISHPSGIIILTPHGKTSLYMLGATYPQELLRRGVAEAKQEVIGPKTETILLGCFQYDPKTGKFRLVVENALKVSGIATALILFGSIFIMSKRNRREALTRSDLQGGSSSTP